METGEDEGLDSTGLDPPCGVSISRGSDLFLALCEITDSQDLIFFILTANEDSWEF